MFRISEQLLGTCSATARGNAGFAIGVQGFALGGPGSPPWSWHAHAAVKAGEQARFRQALHIAAHRLQRDPQGVGSCSTVADLRVRNLFAAGVGGVGVHGGGTRFIVTESQQILKYLIGASDGAFETVNRKTNALRVNLIRFEQKEQNEKFESCGRVQRAVLSQAQGRKRMLSCSWRWTASARKSGADLAV